MNCSSNYNDILLATFGAFLGSIGGLIVALWIERLKRPKLRIAIAPHSDQVSLGIQRRFLYLHVRNIVLCRPFRWFLIRESALSCYARIEFLRLDRTAFFARPMDARWSESPQPPQLAQNGVVYPNVIDVLRYRDIHTNRSERLDVAFKCEGATACYGFTNTSYVQPALQDPEWLLPGDRYLVRVSIFTGSFEKTETFTLRNDWPRTDFQLQDIF